MKRIQGSAQRGQSILEYALLLALVALIVIPVVVLYGRNISDMIQQLFGTRPAATQVVSTGVPTGVPTEAPTEIPTEVPVVQTPINTISQDFMKRIMDFYNKNGKWPKTSGDKQFTDLGLKPGDWDNPVEGITWDPAGSEINLTIKKEDNIKAYVNDLNGNNLQIFSNWKIICVATSGICYYHTVAPGNEVDINSLVVVNTKKD